MEGARSQFPELSHVREGLYLSSAPSHLLLQLKSVDATPLKPRKQHNEKAAKSPPILQPAFGPVLSQ